MKMRWMKKGIPAVHSLGQPARPLEMAPEDDADDGARQGSAFTEVNVAGNADSIDNNGQVVDTEDDEGGKPIDLDSIKGSQRIVVPPTKDEYIWMWKVSTYFETRHYFAVLIQFLHSLSLRQRDEHSSCSLCATIYL